MFAMNGEGHYANTVMGKVNNALNYQ